MSQDNVRESILNKVKGLAAIANPESGAFPGEIANASAVMQRLMDKYQTSWEEVVLTQKEVSDHFVGIDSQSIIGSFRVWHWALGRVIARITGTKHYRTGAFGTTLRDKKKKTHGKRMCFFGSESTAQVAADLFDLWVVLIDDMAKAATAEYVRKMTIDCADDMREQGVRQFRHLQGLGTLHPNIWRDSWLEGVIAGINSALYEAEHARDEQTSTALMVIQEKVLVAYEEFSAGWQSVNTSSRSGNLAAYKAGVAKGKTINLNSHKSPRLGKGD